MQEEIWFRRNGFLGGILRAETSVALAIGAKKAFRRGEIVLAYEIS